MSYKVAILQNSTGIVHIYKHPADWDFNDGLEEYIWSEGNYSCDCNRHLFFYRAIGIEPDNCDCGESKYRVLYVELPDGSRPYEETAGDGNPHPTTTKGN